MQGRLVPLALSLFVSTAACHEDIGGPERVQVSGVVRSAELSAPIHGAVVRIDFVEPFGTRRTPMATATTGVDGRYQVSLGAPPGYAYVNCSVLEVEVSAPGYITTWMPLEWVVSREECHSGAVSLDLELYTEPG